MIEEDLSVRSGSRRLICESTKRLLKSGHDVRIFTGKMNTKTCFEDLLHLPVEVVPQEKPRINILLKQILNREIGYYWLHNKMVMETGKRVAKWRPDAVLFHYTGELWLPPYFYYLEKPVGIVFLHTFPRCVTPFPASTLRDKIDGKIVSLPPLGRWRSFSLKKLAMIVSHSDYVRREAVKIPNDRPVSHKLIPLGVDHTEFHPTGEEEPFVLCVARLDPKKNLELAVHAMEDSRSDFSLVIAGDVENRFTWYRDKLQNLAKKSKILERFKIIQAPTHSQVIRLIQTCSVFLFPSANDTFGVTVLEAMACGKPIIASNAGGVPEVLGDCGFLLYPAIKPWQETLRKLLSDSGLREQLGSRAVKRSKLFSWDLTVDSILHEISNFSGNTKRL